MREGLNENFLTFFFLSWNSSPPRSHTFSYQSFKGVYLFFFLFRIHFVPLTHTFVLRKYIFNKRLIDVPGLTLFFLGEVHETLAHTVVRSDSQQMVNGIEPNDGVILRTKT